MRRHRRRMLALILILPFLGVFCDPCPKASPAFEDKLYKPGARDKAFGLHFSDDKNGWIVGDRGLALRTADAGKNWQKVMISEAGTFNDVCFVGKKGWVVGAVGMILSTKDGGETWEKQASNTIKSLMKVIFFDGDKGFTVGADGTILRTMNGGSSWENISIDCMELLPAEMMEVGIITLSLYDIFFVNENSGWIVGDSGSVLHSEDGGKEWRIANVGLLPPLFSISFMDENKAWAVGQNGFSLKTDDGGKHWEKVVIDEENSLYRIRTSNKHGVIVGDHATIYQTKDGGETWDKIAHNLNPPYPWLTDAWIFPSDPVKVLSVGKGILLETKIISKN